LPRRRHRRLSPPARRLLRNLALIAFAGFVLVGAAAGFRLLKAARDLRSAQSLVESASDALDAGQVAKARSDLVEATTRLSRASGQLHGHPELGVVRAVPVLGGNLESIRDSVAAATELTDGGARLLAAAAPLERSDGSLEVPLRSGAIPLDAVKAVQAEADALAASLPDPDDLREAGALLPPVRELRDTIADELDRRGSQVESLADGLAILADLAGGAGDRAYLVAVANTAEMRGAGGMILSYGGLIGKAGDFELTHFGRIDELALDEPVDPSFVPSLPADYLRRWEGFDPLYKWRNATVGADFTMVAPALEAMFAARTELQADGVIQIDPQGLAGLLGAIGPVEVKGLGKVGVDNLVPLVLHEAYIKYQGIERRSDVLKDVAEAAFTALVNGQYESVRAIGTALAEAVEGRHLMFHTWHPEVQEHVADLGADGALPPLSGPDSVHLTVQNVSGNKLDWFVDTELGLSGDVSPGKAGTVRAEVVVHNDAPKGAKDPRYIFGPFNEDQEVGLYRGVVSLYLPQGATLLSASGDPPRDPPISVSEGGRPVVSWTVDLPAGATSHVVLDLRLPPRSDSRYQLIAVPSPRVRPTILRTALETGRGRVSETLTLDRTWRLVAGEAPKAVLGRP
jgi:hypothetical protein